MSACPKDAIFVSYDEYGAAYPRIDSDKCIECGICRKICPANEKLPLKRAPHSYAAWSEYEPESSSGGIAAVMSKHVLSMGGAVYGAAVTERRTKHIRVTEETELQKLRGSKYVQSDIGLIYRDVKLDLEGSICVLFIGTPCQVAGLKAYLRRDYENLITVDLVCHGTPPHKYLEEHLDKQTKGNWDSYSFRGRYDYVLTAYKDRKITYQKSKNEDLYFHAFLKKIICRENCYNCFYARPERVSDITIGDFWGLDRSTLKEIYKGRISLVLPNTEKGTAFFECIKSQMVREKRTLEEALNKKQVNLIHPTKPNKERDDFLNYYMQFGFLSAISKTSIRKEVRKNRLKKSIPFRILRKAKRTMSRIIKN